MAVNLHSQLVQEQAQAERTAGKLLTMVCHQQSASERARLLSLAFWSAGEAIGFEKAAQLQADGLSDKPRGGRR